MGRIVKSGSAGKDRILLEKGVVSAIHELARQSTLDETTYDLLAFIVLSLKAISETVEESVAAWEKRGYWVKADHYRMEWNWSQKLSEDLKRALVSEDWVKAATITAQVTERLSKVKISKKNQNNSPWKGSWKRLIQLQ